MSYEERFKRAQQLAMQTMNRFPERVKEIPPDPYQDEAFGNWVSDVEATIDMVSLKNVYFSETWVYICTNIVARKISRQPLTINREFLQDGNLVVRTSEDHKLLPIFDNPNQFEGYANFMYKLASELTLMGNAIIWRLRFHNQMMILPTEIVTIETDKSGAPLYYLVNFSSIKEFQDVYSGTMRIHAKDIIHIKLPHLNSMLWGLSPYVPGRKSVLFDKYTKEFLLNFYLRQANPGPVLEMGELANEKQAMRLLKSIEINWTGRRNLRRTMILPKGVSAKNLQQTMAEQQLKEHLNINRDDIRGLLAIPPHELGTQETGSIGSEETKEQIKNFWNQTIIPFQNLIADGFTHYFQKELGKRTYFAFDNTDVGVLQDDENKKADLAIKQLNVKTLNEVRKDLYDLEPLPGGDTVRGTQQDSPFGGGSFNFQNPPVNDPPLSENDEDNQELEDDETVNSSEPVLKTDGFLRHHKEWWLGRKKKEDDVVSKNERKILRDVLDIFENQAEIAVKNFQKIFKDRLKQKQNGFLPEEEQLRSALSDAFTKFEKVYVRSTVPTLQATGEVGYDIHMTVPFNIPSVDEIAVLRTNNEEQRKATLAARALTNFQKFTATTTDDILKVIERGVRKSKTLDDITKDIFTYFGEAVPGRAKTIARTETLIAVSLGQKAAEEDAGTVIKGLQKVWITAGDERVRDSHIALDGEMVPVNKSFKSGNGNSLEFPRDPRAPANDTINCFVFDTEIETGSIKDATKSPYTGDVVTIKTESGVTLCATPNHPILTNRGWIPIGKLDKGDKVINAKLRHKFIPINANIKDMPTKIGEIYNSLSDSFDVVGMPSSVVNFHGDRPTGNIDIVNVDGLLQDRIFTDTSQGTKNLNLHDSDLGKSSFLSDSGLDESIGGVTASHGDISSRDLKESFISVHASPLDFFGLTSASLGKTISFKMSNDSDSSPSSKLTDLVYTHFFTEVKEDKIVDVLFTNFSGHVYNLHTNEGWYIANNIITHNCRCTWLMVPPEDQNIFNTGQVEFTGRNPTDILNL